MEASRLFGKPLLVLAIIVLSGKCDNVDTGIPNDLNQTASSSITTTPLTTEYLNEKPGWWFPPINYSEYEGNSNSTDDNATLLADAIIETVPVCPDDQLINSESNSDGNSSSLSETSTTNRFFYLTKEMEDMSTTSRYPEDTTSNLTAMDRTTTHDTSANITTGGLPLIV